MIGIDVIIYKRKHTEFEEWCDLFADELMEIYHLEGANSDMEYEDWLLDFYEGGGDI
jgi:hypothetical protein